MFFSLVLNILLSVARHNNIPPSLYISFCKYHFCNHSSMFTLASSFHPLWPSWYLKYGCEPLPRTILFPFVLTLKTPLEFGSLISRTDLNFSRIVFFGAPFMIGLRFQIIFVCKSLPVFFSGKSAEIFVYLFNLYKKSIVFNCIYIFFAMLIRHQLKFEV